MFTTKMVATATCIDAVANSPINEASGGRVTPLHRMLKETIEPPSVSAILRYPNGHGAVREDPPEGMDLSEYTDILKNATENLENSFIGKGSIYDPRLSLEAHDGFMSGGKLPASFLDNGWYKVASEEGITKKFINHCANHEEAPDYFIKYLQLEGKTKIFENIDLRTDPDLVCEEAREATLSALEDLFEGWNAHLIEYTREAVEVFAIPPSWAVHIAAEEGVFQFHSGYFALIPASVIALLTAIVFFTMIVGHRTCDAYRITRKAEVMLATGGLGALALIPGCTMLMEEGIHWGYQSEAINNGIIDETFGFAALGYVPELIVAIGSALIIIALIGIKVLMTMKLYQEARYYRQ